MTRDAIREQVLRAFAGVPRPAPPALISHPCCECDELAAALSPFVAGGVPEPVLAKHVWDLPLLSDAGKHFYLPAWLLRGLEEGGGSAIDAVLYALDTDHRWRPEPAYTEAQWLAVDAWLAHVASTGDAPADDVARVRGKLPW